MEDPRTSSPLARSDVELWRLAAAGDPSAFEALFDRHAKTIYNYCFRRTGDWTAAEDLMATTFLHAWRRVADVELDPGGPLPWLYGVATNLVWRHLRGAGRRRAALARLPLAMYEPDHADETADRIDDAARIRQLLVVLTTLPPDEQDVLVLCTWQDLSYTEAALALGIPIGTVKSRLSRAKAHVRRRWTEPLDRNGDEMDTDAILTLEREGGEP